MNRFENETIGVIKEKPRTFLGIIGAIAGALLGALLWVVLYQIGIIASIAGIAIVYCACKGYALLSLSKSKALTGVIVAIIISVVVLLLTIFFCWGLDIYNELSLEYEISFFEAVLFVPEVAFSPDFIVEFVEELLIGLIFIGVGSAPFLRQAARSRKTEQQ